VILNQFRLPLFRYAADGVNLAELDKVEFRFGGTGVNTTGAIQFADLAFQKVPASITETPVPLTRLASDPPIPAVDAVKTGEPRLDLANTADGTSACVDRSKPTVKIAATAAGRNHLIVSGTAADSGCTTAGSGSVQRVQVTIGRRVGKACRFVVSSGRLTRATECSIPASVVAVGGRHWRMRLKHAPPPGAYTVVARAIDGAGNFSPTSIRKIEVSR
jgi:hypothetical protein